jgi:hypothetical protein
MGKRLRLDIHLTSEERSLAIDYFKYTKSLRRTTELVKFLFHRKGKADNITRNSVRNWLRKRHPELYEAIKQEAKTRKIQKKLENPQKEEYDLRNLVYVGRR